MGEKRASSKSAASVQGLAKSESVQKTANLPNSKAPATEKSTQMDQKLEIEARSFLAETVGIEVNPTQSSPQKPWTCLSCLLTRVYRLFCRAGPEGDAQFWSEIEQTKFERV